MPDLPVIDPNAIANLRELDPENGDTFLREIIGIFCEDTPQRIAELEQCLVAGDLTTFSRAAHSIKGSSANLGAILLRGAAEELEQRSRISGLAGIDSLLANVKTEFIRAKAELDKLVTSP